MMVRKILFHAAALMAAVVLLSSCGIRRHKYDNPISKDTQQPDKVLFDTAINDIEHSRFERARLTLQTLMNTYDTSEYLAKAKLAVADSWYREGGAHGYAQAEAEYKDFELFYPTMEESAEAQEKICKMQYNQMDKADRDPLHALRAEDECRTLITQYPNSKFAPEAKDLLLKIQEVLADKEFKVGYFYWHKGSFASAANRMQGLSDQFPLYSHADEALWDLADSYRRMGDKFENAQASALTRIVKDYPLSAHVDEAKSKLKALNRPIPEADPVQVARMKYEQENRSKQGLVAKAWSPFSSRPDTTAAAKSGTPQMTGFRPMIPKSVPPTAAGAAETTNEVTAAVAPDASALDRNPNELAKSGTAGTPPADPNTPPAMPVVVTRTGIDINTAPEAQLAQIFGKTTARKVMALRPYSSLKDLIRAGIAQKTIDRLTPALAPTDANKSDK
jgi:outer membrane protein assembly factor BamD